MLKQEGFTLIEIMMVIIVASIMATVSIEMISSDSTAERFDVTLDEMLKIRNALVGNTKIIENGGRSKFGYIGDVGALPAQISELMNKPSAVGAWATDAPSRIASGWNGPYVRKDIDVDFLTDAWGNSYVWDSVSDPAILTSLGADGVTGGTGFDQDIVLQIPSTLIRAQVFGAITNGGSAWDGDAQVEINYPDGLGGVKTSTLKTLSAGDQGSFDFTGVPLGQGSVKIFFPDKNSPTQTVGPITFVVGSGKVLIDPKVTDPLLNGGGGGGPNLVIDLLVSDRSSTGIQLGWTEPLSDPDISDYVVEYKISSETLWVVVDDGVSSRVGATVSGLSSSTSYDFRVKAFNGDYSDYSNVVSVKTASSSNSFFNASTYTAINISGAEDSSVVAFEDDTKIYKNGDELRTLNAGEIYEFSSSSKDILSSTKPFFVGGQLGDGEDEESGNFVWTPRSWTGTEFSFIAPQEEGHRLKIYAFENSTITLKDKTGVVVATKDISDGELSSLSFNASGAYTLSSTGVVGAIVYTNNVVSSSDSDDDDNDNSSADDDDNDDDSDDDNDEEDNDNDDDDSSDSSENDNIFKYPMPLLPSSRIIIGFPSKSGLLFSNEDNTSYNFFHSGGTAGSGIVGREAKSLTPLGEELGFYKTEALRLDGLKKLFAISLDDGSEDGAACFLPTALMKYKYAINVKANWVTLASTQSGIIKMISPSGSTTELTLQNTGADPSTPYSVRVSEVTQGYRFESTIRFAAWYDPDSDDGSGEDDETLLFGFD